MVRSRLEGDASKTRERDAPDQSTVWLLPSSPQGARGVRRQTLRQVAAEEAWPRARSALVIPLSQFMTHHGVVAVASPCFCLPVRTRRIQSVGGEKSRRPATCPESVGKVLWKPATVSDVQARA